MVKDQEIFIRIAQKLACDTRIDPSNIIIIVKNGIVILTGPVSIYAVKLMPEDKVKSIKEVKGVVEEIKVHINNYQRVRTDTNIADAVRNTLKWNIMIPEKKIQIMVKEGIVSLTGEVLYNYQREIAASAVRYVQGVKNVLNNIRLKPFVNPLDIKTKISKEFKRNSHIDFARVSLIVDGSKVILQGTVRSWEEQTEADKIAWSTPGVTNVENLITAVE